MRGLLRTIGNAALVIGGFFVVFFGVSKVSAPKDNTNSPQPNASAFGDIAYADAPYSQSYYQTYYQASYGDSGDSGSGDGGGGDGGK